MDDEYYYPKINENRRRKFFKYLAVEWKLHRHRKAKEYRKEFVEKLDTLRGVESVGELKKRPERSEAEMERKIQDVLKREADAISAVDLKEEINRSKVDEMGERLKQMQEVINQLLEEKRAQKEKEAELEKRLFRIKKKQLPAKKKNSKKNK
jgi:hypothetical protein